MVTAEIPWIIHQFIYFNKIIIIRKHRRYQGMDKNKGVVIL